MSSKILLTDLSANMLAFIYQFLEGKDMVLASSACKKMRKAFNQDYIYIELTKRDHLFLPSEGEKFNTWKEYFLYLKQLRKNISSGKPNIGFKMIPYRGHKAPIEAIEYFNHKKEMITVLVSGDSNGEVLTWNIDEDGDKERDLIIKANDAIAGIKSLNDDCNMIVWSKKNTFYYYNVNMFINTEKNSERFKLVSQVTIEENDDPIKQLYYEKKSSKIFMSPDLSSTLRQKIIYSLDLKTFTYEKYKFDYNSSQTNSVLNDNNNNNNIINFNQGWNNFNNNNNNNNVINPLLYPHFPHPQPFIPNNMNDASDYSNNKESRKKNIKYFAVNEDKIFLYINREPIKDRLISSYNNKNALPNVFVFKKNTYLANSYHIDLDYIFNIFLLDEDEVAFIGTQKNNINHRKQVCLKIYKTSYFSLSKEIVLYEGNLNNFDLLSYKDKELHFLINEKILKKIENVKVNKLKVVNIQTLKEIPSVNCIDSDEFRVVLGSDELFMAIFDIKTGKLWFNLLGGSKSVFPASFMKHPNYDGFHLLIVTRNSILSAIGNLIREYRFTFKYGKK